MTFQLSGLSLVTRCPYCGTDDWDEQKTKPDGTVCNHPTKFISHPAKAISVDSVNDSDYD